MTSPPWLPRPVTELLPHLEHAHRVWLVGGAVRDAFLQRELVDLDFVVQADALALARRLANRLGGAFYPLDEPRGVGRVILQTAEGRRRTLDFSDLRGPDLAADLQARDFTLNAMGVALDRPEELIDPGHGLQDLRDRRLRLCRADALLQDPVRCLRAVRLAAELDLRIEPETARAVSEAVGRIGQVSAERIRDELFRILELPRPVGALRVADHLGIIAEVLPELAALRGVTQPAPHASDVWQHTLAVVERLGELLIVLGPEHDPEASADLFLGQAVMILGRYRTALGEHLSDNLSVGRSARELLLLTALYHDAGKPDARSTDAGGIRFLRHEQVGSELARRRAGALRLGRTEVDRVAEGVLHHMRPGWLEAGGTISRRAIYRFYRDAGDGAPAIILLSLADLLGTHAPTPPPEAWKRRLEVARRLLEAWYEEPRERIHPPALIRGDELARALKIDPGPALGTILERIREATAAGEVADAEQALALARTLHERGLPPEEDASEAAEGTQGWPGQGADPP